MEALSALIKQFGLAAGLFAFALLVMASGKWVRWTRELDAANAQRDKREADLVTQCEKREKELIAEIQRERIEKEKWQAECIKLYGGLAQATSVLKDSTKVADKAMDIARSGPTGGAGG